MCEMSKLDNEQSAALLHNGLSKVKIHANTYNYLKS